MDVDAVAAADLTVAAAAAVLGCSAGKLYRLITLGELAAHRAGLQYRLSRATIDHLQAEWAQTSRPHGSRRHLRDAELRTAIAALRAGHTSTAAATAAGLTDRGLRKRLAALGLTASEFQPAPPEPAALDAQERRRRLAALAQERQWARQHANGATAYNRQAETRRRDLHILLTVAAWDAIHAEAARRQCSLSSLVAEVLFDAGLIPEP